MFTWMEDMEGEVLICLETGAKITHFYDEDNNWFKIIHNPANEVLLITEDQEESIAFWETLKLTLGIEEE